MTSEQCSICGAPYMNGKQRCNCNAGPLQPLTSKNDLIQRLERYRDCCTQFSEAHRLLTEAIAVIGERLPKPCAGCDCDGSLTRVTACRASVETSAPLSEADEVQIGRSQAELAVLKKDGRSYEVRRIAGQALEVITRLNAARETSARPTCHYAGPCDYQSAKAGTEGPHCETCQCSAPGSAVEPSRPLAGGVPIGQFVASLIVSEEEAKQPLAFRHWSKDELVPYAGCHCDTCKQVKAGGERCNHLILTQRCQLPKGHDGDHEWVAENGSDQ